MFEKDRVEIPPFRVRGVFDTTGLAETIDWGLSAYHIPEVWKETRGKGVRVAVLDNGCELVHPDLVNQIDGHRDFTGEGWESGDHGTHVAGIVAAQANDRGVVGVAPEARLHIGRVLSRNGGSSYDVAQGIYWAVDHCMADIISLSLGSPNPDAQLLKAIDYALSKGRFVIAAAGNDGRDDSVNYPARWSSTIAVGSVERNGRLSPFSSRGDQVDICAPGQDITSCWPGARYAKLSGTSMATPFVTGVVALMISKHRANVVNRTPLKTIEELREHIARTAVDAGPAGKDPGFGFGLIDPESVIKEDDDAPQPPPVEEEPSWVPLLQLDGVALELFGVTVCARSDTAIGRWASGGRPAERSLRR